MKKLKYNYHKLPLYMRVAFDFYIDHMSINEVAEKYDRTRRQIQWLISKSIRPNLPNLWQQIKKHIKNESIGRIPIYAEIAIDMCRNQLSVIDVMKKYNKSRKQINDSLSRASRQLPIIYDFINNNILKKENEAILKQMMTQ